LLFMQPIQLHRLLAAWGMKNDPSLLKLVPRLRAREPIALAIVGRLAVCLLVGMPVVTFVAASLLTMAGVEINWVTLVRNVGSSIAFGIAGSVAFGGAFGVAFGVVAGVATGIAAGATTVVGIGVTSGAAMGVAIGVAIGVDFGIAVGAPGGVERGTARGVAYSLAVTVVIGIGIGTSVDVQRGVAGGISVGVSAGIAAGVATLLTVFRVPMYPFEALVSLSLAWWTRVFPGRPPAADWLPFRQHDLINFPLLGLKTYLLQLSEHDPGLTRNLLAEAAASPGQKGVAHRTLIELQARALERAAQARDFAKTADLDLPFLPSADNLEPDSPFRPFRSVAGDLRACSEGGNHRQRRLALERARGTLHGFLNAQHPSHVRRLGERLRTTARIWLETTADEERRLAADEQAHPQVPLAFVAGPDLKPGTTEDKAVFKGRKDLARIVDHELDPDRRGVLVIVGQRRMGKTSFRNWLPSLLDSGARVVSANFQELSGRPERATPHRWLLDLIAASLRDAPPPPTSPHWGDALAWLRERDATLGDGRVLVVIDEVERVEDGIRAGWCSTDFLDFLRAAGDSLHRIRFLLLTAYPLQRLGPHWVDRLVSATTQILSYLDPESAQELIRSPIPDFPDIYPAQGVERILRETHRHPYLIQKVCDGLCQYLNAHGGRRRATDDELTEVLDRLLNEDNLFDEFWRQRSVEEQHALRRLAHAQGPLDADPATRQLAREGYVEMEGDRATVAVPLFAAWIRRTQGESGSSAEA
jgi:hypothetical protein